MTARPPGPVAGIAACVHRLVNRKAAARRSDTTTTARDRPARDAERGESLAAAHLESLGFSIVARNLRLGPDEADLVAIVPAERVGDPPLVAIVEVKTSRMLGAPPHTRIDAGKQRRMVRLAERLCARREFADVLVRFDAVGVDLGAAPPRIEHLPHCFEARSPRDRSLDRRGRG